MCWGEFTSNLGQKNCSGDGWSKEAQVEMVMELKGVVRQKKGTIRRDMG